MMGNLFSKNRKYDFRPEVCLRNIFSTSFTYDPEKSYGLQFTKNHPMVLTLTKAKKAKMKNIIDQAVFYHV